MADHVKGRARGAVTAERFSQGMTFDPRSMSGSW
jgi:hypothetical protein